MIYCRCTTNIGIQGWCLMWLVSQRSNGWVVVPHLQWLSAMVEKRRQSEKQWLVKTTPSSTAVRLCLTRGTTAHASVIGVHGTPVSFEAPYSQWLSSIHTPRPTNATIRRTAMVLYFLSSSHDMRSLNISPPET